MLSFSVMLSINGDIKANQQKANQIKLEIHSYLPVCGCWSLLHHELTVGAHTIDQMSLPLRLSSLVGQIGTELLPVLIFTHCFVSVLSLADSLLC